MVIKNANGNKPKKVIVSKNEKEKAKSKAQQVMGKTEIISQPCKTIKDVIEALKKSTAEVTAKNEEFAKKEIDKIVEIKKQAKEKAEGKAKQAEKDFMTGTASKATQTALSKDPPAQNKADDPNNPPQPQGNM